ncbi:MAG: hypothetical protein AB1542_18355 [Pseudomonadota bacterium]
MDSNSASTDVDVVLKIDEETMAALIREGMLMNDSDVDCTIRRRLEEGAATARVMGPADLKLRPVHKKALNFQLKLDPLVVAELDKISDAWGYERDVVVVTILSDGICKPLDVVARERQMAPAADREVRREPGRGNIYPVELQIPGYQLVFVRMLAGHFTDRALVLEEALLALARKIVRGDDVLGAPVSDEARHFARRMVKFAPPEGPFRTRFQS